MNLEEEEDEINYDEYLSILNGTYSKNDTNITNTINATNTTNSTNSGGKRRLL